MATLKIPALYSHYTDKNKEMQLDGTTIRHVFENLFLLYPTIQKHIIDPNGKQRRHINIFLNKINIVDLQKDETPVNQQDVITILPNISGG